MQKLSRFLIISTVLIYLVTAIAIANKGWWWPLVYFGDMLALDWRSQFNTDFLIHLFLRGAVDLCLSFMQQTVF